MKLTINQCLGFESFYNAIQHTTLPIKLGYKFAKIYAAIQVEIDFYRSSFQKLINDCAEHDENNEIVYNEESGMVNIRKDKLEECEQRLQELNALEPELEIEKYLFNIDELDSLNASIQELNLLIPFIQE